MKKVFSLVALFLAISVLSLNAFAAETKQSDTKDEGDIEVSFKVGEDTIKINNREVQVERPFVVQGTTLVPLRVITEAFGAKVDWNEKDRSIALNYSGVSLLLHVDSKEVLVDNQKTTMLEAPVVVNGKTMVPLRFITENFGADVSYDEATKLVTVLKHISSENSIKDFSLILKKTTKEKVGDSFYKWSMNLPKKFKLDERNFNGTFTVFKSDDSKYELVLWVHELYNDTLDTYIQKALDKSNDNTILDQGKKTKEGIEYYTIVYKDKNYTYNERFFVKDGYAFILSLEADNDKYKNDKEIGGILDSYGLNFEKDGNTEDLSDVTPEGFRMFENKQLKFSAKIPADWRKIDDKDKPNNVVFVQRTTNKEERSNLVVFEMNSIDEGMSIGSWVEKEIKNQTDIYNPDVFKIEPAKDATLNNNRAKLVVSTLKEKESTIFMEDYYVYGDKYKYHVYYNINPATEADPTKKGVVQGIMSSFSFSEPNADEVGKLIDPDMIPKIETMKKLESKDYKWSCSIPAAWKASKDNNDSDKVSYYDKEINMIFQINVMNMPKVSLSDFKTNVENGLSEDEKNGKIIKYNSKSISIEKISGYKYDIHSNYDNGKYYVTQYILEKGDNFYLVIFIVDEEHYNEKIKSKIEEIFNTFKLN